MQTTKVFLLILLILSAFVADSLGLVCPNGFICTEHIFKTRTCNMSTYDQETDEHEDNYYLTFIYLPGCDELCTGEGCRIKTEVSISFGNTSVIGQFQSSTLLTDNVRASGRATGLLQPVGLRATGREPVEVVRPLAGRLKLKEKNCSHTDAYSWKR